jgi:hypothetical protein
VTETEAAVSEIEEAPALTLVEVVPLTLMLMPDIEIDSEPDTVMAAELTESFVLALTVVCGEVSVVELAETESVEGFEMVIFELEVIVRVGEVMVICWGLLWSSIETVLDGSDGE